LLEPRSSKPIWATSSLKKEEEEEKKERIFE
jgi:hypothetical protein